MSSIFQNYVREVLVDTVVWVFHSYRTHGFNLTYWPAMLDIWVEMMREKLSAESFKEIYPFYNWLLISRAAFTNLSDKEIAEKGQSLH